MLFRVRNPNVDWVKKVFPNGYGFNFVYVDQVFSKVIILSPVVKSKTIYEELQLSDIIYQELENEKGKTKYQN